MINLHYSVYEQKNTLPMINFMNLLIADQAQNGPSYIRSKQYNVNLNDSFKNLILGKIVMGYITKKSKKLTLDYHESLLMNYSSQDIVTSSILFTGNFCKLNIKLHRDNIEDKKYLVMVYDEKTKKYIFTMNDNNMNTLSGSINDIQKYLAKTSYDYIFISNKTKSDEYFKIKNLTADKKVLMMDDSYTLNTSFEKKELPFIDNVKKDLTLKNKLYQMLVKIDTENQHLKFV